MRAQVLLADSAQGGESSTKVHALGLGWSTTSTPLPPGAVIVLVKVPWNATNTRHELRLELVDQDGKPPQVPADDTGEEVDGEIVIEQQFEVGRPPGLPPGIEIDHSLTVNYPPGMPLKPGMYSWRLQIDGHHDEEWTAPFYVRPS